MRSKPHIHDDAFTGLSGDLRPRSNAERGSARCDWGCERHRLTADRLARRKISEAHPSRSSLHPAFVDLRRLFRVAAYSDKYCGDGAAVVARLGAAHWWSGRRDFWHPIHRNPAWVVLRRAPAWLVAWSMGRWVDLRPFRLRRMADWHGHRPRRWNDPNRGRWPNPRA